MPRLAVHAGEKVSDPDGILEVEKARGTIWTIISKN